ncbi:MAG: hypothetical protein IJT72_03485 [Lachnospiraceae bacterium]|nr:hypothetical protein [Lachnospiraceae bacterium]
MREWFRQLPAKIVEFWNRYTAKQKTLFFSVVAAVIITLVALFVILNRTSYTRLATFDNSAQTAEAEALLKENGIKHRVSDDALSIDVDEKKIAEARLLLGQNGISASASSVDNSWLFDNSFSTTDSERKLKAKIKLEADMEADIKSMEGVTKASVTIDLPDSSSSIYNNEKSTTVSIMLTTNSNFKNESVSGIAEYARTCVGNEDTNDITIIDKQGNLLFSGANNSTTVLTNLSIEQQVEEYYNSKLWNLMVNSGVYDDVSVSSNLDINISPEEIEDIKYYTNTDDDTGPKETYYYYLAENVDGTGGVVGTDANGEEITDYNLLDEANSESTLTLIKETYATSSTKTKTVKSVGSVELANSSISLYLTKYNIYYEEELEKQGLLEGTTYEEFKQANSEPVENINPPEIVSLLSKGTGIKEANIYVIERTVPIFYPKEKKSVPVQSILSIVLAVIIGVLLLFVVFRSMKAEEVVETEPELSVETLLATTKENQTLDDIEFGESSATKSQIEKFVDENPEAVALLLRNWLNDEWE